MMIDVASNTETRPTHLIKFDNSLRLYRVKVKTPKYDAFDGICGSHVRVSGPLTLREAMRAIRAMPVDDTEVYVHLVFIPTGKDAEPVKGAEGDGSYDGGFGDEIPF